MLSVQKVFCKYTSIKVYLERMWQGLQSRPVDLWQVQDAYVVPAFGAPSVSWHVVSAQ